MAIESLFADEYIAVFDSLGLEILSGNVGRILNSCNTLQYRLDKIWKETGYNPREFKDATVLNVALNMLGDQ